MEQPKPKLLDVVRDRIRAKHYSYRTEKSYTYWIKWYVLHHNKRHPRDMGAPEIESFLSHLAVERNVCNAANRKPTIEVSAWWFPA